MAHKGKCWSLRNQTFRQATRRLHSGNSSNRITGHNNRMSRRARPISCERRPNTSGTKQSVKQPDSNSRAEQYPNYRSRQEFTTGNLRGTQQFITDPI
eukprot:scaffold77928_cov33-Prasinocladus_malaysianus.AAC.1